ncbi:MAG: peptidase M50 (zinc protease) [Candidatus Berkelbacteria bacterium Gr01-1014_85]|uniref:Peptidase M50 (Zinc protease) n=1 Tax=Candidatus Berkelbacteria bacterium Gr01-1014_85 TaxID=2017150 RepID=A0A554JDZ7_9BACT|nr:MAG: peptidase M50 (zinc protease) [Candidatus Berkelbacteria bacterium Gr01-1014_85]
MLASIAENPTYFWLTLAHLVIAITIHELSHALAASRLGDDTAEAAGRLTLNPLAHLDLMGTVFLVLFGFGWGKPTPVNASRLGSPKRDSILVALAGPLANLILIGLWIGLLLIFSPELNSIAWDFSRIGIQLNLVLALFNLLPFPPLDGSAILMALLPPRAQGLYTVYGQWTLLILIILSLIGVRFLEALISWPIRLLSNLL